MKDVKYILAAFVAVCAIVVCSCHKDDDTVYFYLDGTLGFDLDEYLPTDTTVVLTPYGVTHPEGGEIYYVWSTDASSDADTVDVYYFEIKDTLKTYAITCSARADGYVSTSTTLSTTIVKGGLDGTGSITDSIGEALVDLRVIESIVDERDNKTYYYTTVDGMDWFIQNLAYSGTDDTPLGRPYSDAVAMWDVFGGYYNFEDASVACPDGWRLPTMEEWTNLVGDNNIGTLMANAYFNTEKMWEFWPVVKISNTTKFTALPLGYYDYDNAGHTDMNNKAIFWSSTEDETNPEKADVFYMIVDQPDMYEAYMNKSYFWCSVRCVR